MFEPAKSRVKSNAKMVANSVAQNNKCVMQPYSLVDNRLNAIAQENQPVQMRAGRNKKKLVNEAVQRKALLKAPPPPPSNVIPEWRRRDLERARKFLAENDNDSLEQATEGPAATA